MIGHVLAGKPRFTRRMIQKAILGDPDVLVYGKDGKSYPQGSSRGVKSTICARLGCSRQTLDNYLERFPELVTLIESESETIVDMAENKLIAALDKGDMRAILFVLETKGKRRGWSKRTEITGADGVPFGLSPDVVELLRTMGVEPNDAVREFEAMVRQGLIADG